MLTQSLGVPSTTHVGQPRPASAAAECTGRWRDLDALVQLCSTFGADDEDLVARGDERADQLVEEDGRRCRRRSLRGASSLRTATGAASGAFFWASSSFMAALRERRTLPERSSMPTHLTVDHVAHLDDVLGAAHAEVRELGDVHEALLARGALDEAAEVLDAGDAARVELADLDRGAAAAAAAGAAAAEAVDLLDGAGHGVARCWSR